jgi:alpha-1,2-mannosyltransferase
MAIPLVWLLGQGLRSGFLPFEKALMAFAFLLPLISRAIAGAIGLPLAPLTIAAVFALTLRRALRPAVDGGQRVARDMRIKFPLSLLLEQ